MAGSVSDPEPLTGAELIPLHLPIPGNERNLTITVHPALLASTAAHKLTLVGGVGPLHVAIDRYPSSAEGGGEEYYVRVLDLAAEVEVWHLLARSAHLGRTCAEPAVRWAADRRSFTVELTSDASVTVGLAGGMISDPG